jgi:hypothetical protein
MKAKFVHDCCKCVYTGSSDTHDFYVCNFHVQENPYTFEIIRKTYDVIARFGDDGPEYSSSDNRCVESMILRGWTDIYGNKVLGNAAEVQNSPLVLAYYQAQQFGIERIEWLLTVGKGR